MKTMTAERTEMLEMARAAVEREYRADPKANEWLLLVMAALEPAIDADDREVARVFRRLNGPSLHPEPATT